MSPAELHVRLTPRAKGRDALTGVRDDGVIVARVSAPPVDGRANVALCKLVAAELGVPKSAVSVVCGGKAREKTLRVEGVGADALQTLLERVGAGGR